MPDHHWPSNLLDDLPTKTVLTVLNAEAKGLTRFTDRVLEGMVLTTPDEDRLQHQLLIYAPVLDLRAPVLRATTAPAGVPVTVDGRYVRPPRECATLDEFTALLPQVFSSPELVQTIRRLVADSKSKGLPYFLVDQDEWVGDATTLEDAVERACRRARREDIIDVFELATGKLLRTIDWMGPELKVTVRSEPVDATASRPAAVPPPGGSPNTQGTP